MGAIKKYLQHLTVALVALTDSRRAIGQIVRKMRRMINGVVAGSPTPSLKPP